MKTLYIDCGMGAAGDMLTAALLDLFDDKEAIINKLNALNIPKVEYSYSAQKKCGITGLRMSVKVDGEEEHAHHHDHEHHDHERHDHHHEHEHHEHHHHEHSSFVGIKEIVKHINASEGVKNGVIAVYSLIAEAESKAHGVEVCEVHFHEVGAMDAVADVAAVLTLLEELKVDEIICSPIRVGYGEVHCAHGILPVPAPATAHILKGAPIYAGDIEGETCTPTGAALIMHAVTEFAQMPIMSVESIGYGFGHKDFKRINAVRAILGERQAGSEDSVINLSFNVDDMTAEEIAFACERFFALGAKEVFTQPAYMKKNRMGSLITLLIDALDREKFVKAIFENTTTIGIREAANKRYVLQRREITLNTPYGEVHKKMSEGYGVKKEKYEYEDIKNAAINSGKSFKAVLKEIENQDK